MGEAARIWSADSDTSELLTALGSIGLPLIRLYRISNNTHVNDKGTTDKSRTSRKKLFRSGYSVTHLKIFQASVCVENMLGLTHFNKTIAVVVVLHDAEVNLNFVF